jgi:hypothetical protein
VSPKARPGATARRLAQHGAPARLPRASGRQRRGRPVARLRLPAQTLTAPAPRWRAPPATAQWVTGVRCGQGVLRVPDGYVYSGEWRDDRKHGHGMATYKDGATPKP